MYPLHFLFHNYCWCVPSVLWHCWLGDTKDIQPVKHGCWLVDGDNLTGTLHVVQLQLSPPPPSSLLGVYTVRSSDRPVGPTGLSDQSDEAFTRSDRRTDWSARPRLRPTGLSDQSDRPVGQTVAEPPTSVNQINVACKLISHHSCIWQLQLCSYDVRNKYRLRCSVIGRPTSRT